MKQFMFAAAVVSMVATGCVGSNQFVRNNSGPSDQIVRGQSVSQARGVRTANYQAHSANGSGIQLTGGLLGNLMGKKGKSNGCGYPAECGYAEDCCECSCGYPEDCCCECPQDCCDTSCGCAEGYCCDDTCSSDGCCSSGCCGDGSYGCGSGCKGQNGCRLGQRMVGAVASGMCCPHSGGYPASYNYTPGPPSGQTAYPYYTTRGPRDFLMCNPQPLGPY